MRRARAIATGRSYHLMQRGHGGHAFCLDAQDRQVYLDLFLEAAQGCGLLVHAWSCTDREAHWLVTPQRASAVAEVMQQLGRRYVPMFNRRWSRSGTPFDGRYRSYWVEADVFGLSVARYIDGQAQRQGLVGLAVDWPWSSAGVWAGQRPPVGSPVRELASYWRLGNTPFEREQAYHRMLQESLEEGLLADVHRGLAQGRPMLSAQGWAGCAPGFVQQWALRPRGRPSKTPQASRALPDSVD
ncbi:MAG: transposase [Burkholderiaceae bacterium]